MTRFRPETAIGRGLHDDTFCGRLATGSAALSGRPPPSARETACRLFVLRQHLLVRWCLLPHCRRAHRNTAASDAPPLPVTGLTAV